MPVGLLGVATNMIFVRLVDRGARGVEIDLEQLVPRHHFDGRAGDPGAEVVHAERGVEIQDLVSEGHEHLEHQVNQLVAARAQYDVLGAEAGVVRQRVAHPALQRVRVVLERGVGDGVLHFLRVAVGVFVAVQLDDLVGRNAVLLCEHLRGVHRIVCLNFTRQVRSHEFCQVHRHFPSSCSKSHSFPYTFRLSRR